MSEIKACPFCGDTHPILDEPYNEDEYGVFCNVKCGATGPCDEDGEYAVKLWNTRPIEDALKAEIERLKGNIAALENDLPLQQATEELAAVNAAHERDTALALRYYEENKRLRGALGKYANGEIWRMDEVADSAAEALKGGQND
jgi:hypothetical protein